MTKTSVGFFNEKTKREYKRARYENPELYRFLERATDDLKKNPFCGIKIPRDLWPKEYIRKYSVDNLWKYDLPNAWRLIYTVVKNEIRILAILLEWFDHKRYERKFGYR